MTDPAAQAAADAELRAHVAKVLASQYELDRELGRGGMGIVYKGKDRRLKRTVAIKLLPPEFAFRSDVRSRFLREAETAAQLSHPNIVPIFSVDEREGLVYFVMACVDGDNLAKIMYDQGQLHPDEVRRVVREVADALAYAHKQGVVHRDIKPDNILLDRETGRPMITDFGIARAAESGMKLTATGMAIGTPAYMSPEQAAGDREVDGRSDLYSLGIVAYQMLTGELPFTASNTPAMLVKHISEPPTPITQKRGDIPVDLARAVMMLLAKDPADRFPSAGALVVALDTGNVPELRPGAPVAPMALAGTGAARQSSGTGQRYGGSSFGIDVQFNSPVAAPDAEDIRRWNAAPVLAFRKKLAPYLMVNFILVMLTIFTGKDLIGVTAIWTVYIAWKYAKLWSDGFDWRDVFKQPKDRLLVDVVSETIDDGVKMFDPKKRDELRARRRLSTGTGGLRAVFESNRDQPRGGDLPANLPDQDALVLAGAHADALRPVLDDRTEVLRIVEQLPRPQRDALPGDPMAIANQLADKARAIAQGLADLDRLHPDSRGIDAVEREIVDLEAQANPLDPASEQRVRRLSQLRRQRRSLGDIGRRRLRAMQQLDECRDQLRNLKLELLRLRANSSMGTEGLTTVMARADQLARDVSYALSAGDEISAALNRRSSPGAAGA